MGENIVAPHGAEKIFAEGPSPGDIVETASGKTVKIQTVEASTKVDPSIAPSQALELDSVGSYANVLQKEPRAAIFVQRSKNQTADEWTKALKEKGIDSSKLIFSPTASDHPSVSIVMTKEHAT